MLELVVVATSYLLGSVPSALLVVRLATGADIRSKGSGNVGGTNALRTAGWRVGLLVTVLDVAKGGIPVLLMSVFNPASRWIVATATAAVLGHCFPVWLRFRGGKGVATAFGAFVVITPQATLGALAVWVVVILLFRVVSLASIVAAVAFPLLMTLLDRPALIVVAAASVVVIVVLLRHVGNLRDLVSGRERDMH